MATESAKAKLRAAAARHELLGLSRDQILEMYLFMFLTRGLDERQLVLQRAGKIPFMISAQGAEAAQVGAAFAFRRRQDYFAPYYRDLATNMVAGVRPRDIMAAALARKACPASGGKQMPSHWGDRSLNIISTSSAVTTQLLHAVGLAKGARLQGHDVVVLTGCGEGSSNQGDFHEALNWAAVHKLPVLFMIQNNGYAISTSIEKQLAGGSVSARGAGYGIPGIRVDGTDLLAVYEVAREAHQRARRGEGPTLIEAVTVRLTSHSSDDDQRRYRSAEELRTMLAHDPLIKARAYLLQSGLATETEVQAIEAKVAADVTDATEWAEAQPYAEPEFAFTHVYGEA